jgi:hypothetical protein
MFLQQIQCTGTADSLNNSQQRSRLDTLESEKMIAQIDQIVDHIDELYKKAKEEEEEEEETNEVRSSKIDADQALECARQKLEKLDSREKLVEAFNKFTTSNNLKNIIHKHSTAVQTASIPFWSAMTKTGKKTSELDTQTLTDLLVLREILVVYQENRRLFSTIDRALIAAEGILKNLKKLSKISTTEPNEQQKTHEVDTEPYKLYTKLQQLYFAVKNAKCEYDRQLAEIAKENKISTKPAEQQPTQSDELQQKFDQAFTQLHEAQSNLNCEIWQYYDQQIPRKDYRLYSDENYELLRNWCTKQSQHSELAKELHRQISCFEAAYSRAPRPRNYRIIPQIMTNQLPCLLDPAIESCIDEYMKHVMDPTNMYNVCSSQEHYTDTPHQTNNDNITDQDKIGSSRKITTGMHIPKQADAGATQTDVFAYDNIQKSVNKLKKLDTAKSKTTPVAAATNVMDPIMYSVYNPQSDDDNSRLLTIGGIAILGVVTIGAGWYLFSNNDSNTIDNRKIRSNDNNNNTTKNRKIQLSRKTTTSMQLAKPADVIATKTTDVSAQPNALAQTHQEQTSANKQIK